ncbi:hypothetical protein KP509_18G016300 [Ceratopteris richardii]|uniref:Uncharacterized protein n=1 Tax=Ceratopteris richardii TaxID=49495 RepID=A0A8T2SPF0_CERRI|nr:hypothetical protein KP509_18G016300 [Ceratopteris richardii]
MAGQTEFRAFHDSMLPDMCDRATSPLFLFVWCPFRLDKAGKIIIGEDGTSEIKANAEFNADLRYWLSLVASKSPPSESFKPKVFLAITRKYLLCNRDILALLKSDLETIHSDFKDHVELDIKEGLFEINATEPSSVKSLTSYIFSVAETVLDAAPLESKICEMAREFLETSTSRHKLEPIVSKEKVKEILCGEESLGVTPDKFETVANSLVRSGDTLFYSAVELVVRDVQWFCNKVMGDLLHFNLKCGTRNAGFFTSADLAEVLEEHVNQRKLKLGSIFARTKVPPRKVDGDLLVDLLVCLRLACTVNPQEDGTDLFIPASLSGIKIHGEVPAKKNFKPQKSSVVVGRRLSVNDNLRTFLTPGVFPLLQVTFHRHFKQQQVDVTLAQDMINFKMDGVEVLVELCRMEGQKDFIDVLVSVHKVYDESVPLRKISRADDALEWMEEKVLGTTRQVLAESRGAPGAEITCDIIRPACIESSVEANDRRIVTADRLKHILRQDLEKRGSRIVVNGIFRQ